MQTDHVSALKAFEAALDGPPSDLADAIDRLPMALPDHLVLRALETASEFRNGRHQSRVLAALLLHLSAATLPSAFALVDSLLDEDRERAHLIIMIAQVTPPQLLPRLHAVAQALGEAEERQRALTELARYMPEIFPDVLACAYAIENPDNRLYALVDLLRVRTDIVDAVIAAFDNTENVRFLAWPLCRLATYAPKIIPRALDAIIAGPADYSAQYSLAEMIPHLRPEDAPQMRAVMRHMLASRSDISPLRRALSKQFPDQSWWGDFPD